MKYILLLENDSNTREWFSKLLCEAFNDIRIVEAETLAQAQELFTKHPFSLAIIDIFLEDGIGIDFLNKIDKKKYPGLCCVIVTVDNDPDLIFSALKAGADGYLLKSQGDDKLVGSLKKILIGEPPLSPSVARHMIEYFREKDQKQDVQLTEREKEVLFYIAKGFTRKETANYLEIRPGTVAGYIKRIYVKLDVNTRAEAVIEALRMGLI